MKYYDGNSFGLFSTLDKKESSVGFMLIYFRIMTYLYNHEVEQYQMYMKKLQSEGVIGVAEVNNTFVAISFPKNEEEGKEGEL